MNYLIPIVFFCTFTPGENQPCDGKTALYNHKLHPVTTPMSCLMEGYVDAAQTAVEWKEEHPNKDIEFRVVCKRTEDKV